MADLTKLSKLKLEELGREYGIELDRRLSKAKLVNQLQEHISQCECGNTDDENGFCDGSHETITTPVIQSKGKLYISGKTICQDGSTKVFADKQIAKRMAHKYGGRHVALDDGTYIVKIY